MSNTRSRARWILVSAVVAITFVAATSLAGAGTDTPSRGEAVYNGRVIDLSKSWEGAGACVVWPDALQPIECYDTEAELEQRVTAVEAKQSGALAGGGGAAASSSSCSSYLKLYDGTSYGGSSVWLSTRWTWHNLSWYGFNNRTSSYKVGACSAYFADLDWGGGAWYPTHLTQAYDKSGWMISGWNNDVSSVYIN